MYIFDKKCLSKNNTYSNQLKRTYYNFTIAHCVLSWAMSGNYLPQKIECEWAYCCSYFFGERGKVFFVGLRAAHGIALVN